MASSESYSNIPAGAEGNPEPFTLHVPDEELSHFHSLVELSKIGPETFENLQGGKRRFGLTRDWLAKAKDAWLNDFNWRDDHEAYINSFPNFKIPIKDPECGELSIHFAGLFSAKKDAIPIIFLHGWPGSFVEFLPLLDLLRKKYTPDTLPFHAVVPSLPGYTLSAGPPLDRNFHVKDAARYMNRLMVQLGFGGGYVAQGGDVGYVIASILSGYEECKAVHVNFLMLHQGEAPDNTHGLTEQDLAKLEKGKQWRQTGFGYALEHGTRPATIGLALSSSPLALLSWIAEIVLDNCDEPLPIGVVLRMVALYWFTETFPRSLYPYRSLVTGEMMPMSKVKPLGYSHFPEEVVFVPKAWEGAAFPNMKFRRDHDVGGHFAALEQPALLLADVEEFVSRVVPL